MIGVRRRKLLSGIQSSIVRLRRGRGLGLKEDMSKLEDREEKRKNWED